MKKVYFTMCAVIVGLGLNAQSLRSEITEVTVYGGYDDAKLSFHTGITNITSGSIEGRAFRQNMSVVAGSANQLCWGTDCYSTGNQEVFQSGSTQIIAPQETNNSFIAYYLPNGNQGTTIIQYWIENVNGFGDRAIFTVTYDASTPTFINENTVNANITGAKPNPANDVVTFGYQIIGASAAEFVMVNALGAVVEVLPVDVEGNVAMIDVSGYDSGIYYYQLRTNSGAATTTQKLVVTH